MVAIAEVGQPHKCTVQSTLFIQRAHAPTCTCWVVLQVGVEDLQRDWPLFVERTGI